MTKKIYRNKKVIEWCPNCEYEVKMKAAFKKQKCPKCKHIILLCSLCENKECRKCKLKSKKRR